MWAAFGVWRQEHTDFPGLEQLPYSTSLSSMAVLVLRLAKADLKPTVLLKAFAFCMNWFGEPKNKGHSHGECWHSACVSFRCELA